MKRTLSFYTGFFVLCMILMRLFGLLAKIVLARSITPYEYGIITLIAISIPAMFQFFTNFSFFDLLSHAKYGRKFFSLSILYSIVSVLLILIILVIFLEPVFTFLNLPLDSWGILYLALAIVIFPSAILVDIMGLFRGLRKYSTSTLISFLPPLLRLMFVLLTVVVLNITDLYLILIFFSLPSLVSVFVIVLKDRNIIKSSLGSIAKPSRDLLFFGFSLVVISAFVGLGDSLIRIVISHNLGMEWQAYFDVSLTLVSVLAFFPTALHFISVPEATHTNKKREVLLKSGALGDVSRALFSYLLFSVIILYFYSTQLVNILFSEAYNISAEYVIILAGGYVFLFIQQFLAYLNISFGEVKEYKPLILITIIFLIAIPFVTHILIQLIGFLGAYVSIASFMIMYSIATILNSKDLSLLYVLFHRAERLIITLLVTFIFLFIANLNLIYGIISSLIIFSLLIFGSRYLNKKLIFDLFSHEETH